MDFKLDGDRLRRVVPSPAPRRIVEHRQIAMLLEAGCVVICAGGGGIPTAADGKGGLRGVEAVVDKDHASALLALVISTRTCWSWRLTPRGLSGLWHRSPAGRLEAHPDAILADYAAEFAAARCCPRSPPPVSSHARPPPRSRSVSWPTSRPWSRESGHHDLDECVRRDHLRTYKLGRTDMALGVHSRGRSAAQGDGSSARAGAHPPHPLQRGRAAVRRRPVGGTGRARA